MGKYNFPFDTCEKTQQKSYIKQPYSAFTNLITSIMIFYFLINSLHTRSFFLILSFLFFELFHTFSHSIHIPGNIQMQITHSLSYLINFSLFYFFYNYTKKIPNIEFIILYLLIIALDIYSVIKLPMIFYLFTQAALFLSILFYYKNAIPKRLQDNFYILLFLVFTIIALFINEMYNCTTLLNINETYHFIYLLKLLDFLYFLFYKTLQTINKKIVYLNLATIIYLPYLFFILQIILS